MYTCGDDGDGQCGLNGTLAISATHLLGPSPSPAAAPSAAPSPHRYRYPHSHLHCILAAGKSAVLVPKIPPKLERADAPRVVGASCGGSHSAFVIERVVDAKEDYREDQLEMAAATIEAFFRGNHARHLHEHAEHRKRYKAVKLSRKHKQGHDAHALQQAAAARAIQSGWRLHWRKREEDRAQQLQVMRGLRNEAIDDPAGWSRAKRQLDAAVVGAAFTDAAQRVANFTKASW